MKSLLERVVCVTAPLFAVPLHAHEGHAIVGTMAHEIEHAGWLAGALMLGSIMILLVFSASVKFADKHLSEKERRN